MNFSEHLNSTEYHVHYDEDFYRNNSFFDFGFTVSKLSTVELTLRLSYYIFIILVSLAGNILLIVTVASQKRMHTTTNYYIVNLAVSDILVTSLCTWVKAIQLFSPDKWIMGAVFCRLSACTQGLALVASVLTLTLIASDRFFGIVFCMKAHITERRADVFIALVWICSLAISMPLVTTKQELRTQWLDYEQVWCNEKWSSLEARKIYWTVFSVVLFFVPIVAMTMSYSMIIYKLKDSQVPGEVVASETQRCNKQRRKVIQLLVVLLIVFAVCWIPFIFTVLYSEYRPINMFVFMLPDWYKKVKIFADCLSLTHSAINPIIYGFFNANFRTALKTLCSSCSNAPLQRDQSSTAYHVITSGSYKGSSLKGQVSTKSAKLPLGNMSSLSTSDDNPTSSKTTAINVTDIDENTTIL